MNQSINYNELGYNLYSNFPLSSFLFYPLSFSFIPFLLFILISLLFSHLYFFFLFYLFFYISFISILKLEKKLRKEKKKERQVVINKKQEARAFHFYLSTGLFTGLCVRMKKKERMKIKRGLWRGKRKEHYIFPNFIFYFLLTH